VVSSTTREGVAQLGRAQRIRRGARLQARAASCTSEDQCGFGMRHRVVGVPVSNTRREGGTYWEMGLDVDQRDYRPVLGCGYPGGTAGNGSWALGLIVGINMIFGGASMIGMALAADADQLP
jgi:hypothetical protein